MNERMVFRLTFPTAISDWTGFRNVARKDSCNTVYSLLRFDVVETPSMNGMYRIRIAGVRLQTKHRLLSVAAE